MSDIKAINIDCELTLSAEAEGPKTFSMVANTGEPMNVGLGHPTIIELSGLSYKKSRPVLRDHNPSKPVGHTTSIKLEAGKLLVDGVLSGANSDTAEIIASSKYQFPWQASVGVNSNDVEFTAKGKTVTANGKTWQGPVYVVRSGSLKEVSFVSLGADDNTTAKVAAIKGESMSEDNVKNVKVDAVKAEADRIEKIEAICGDHADIAAKAINEEWSIDQTELAVMRANRPQIRGVRKDSSKNSPAVIAAALTMSAGVTPDITAKYYGEKAVDEATASEYRNEGLQSLCYRVIAAAGMSTRVGNFSNETIRAAFEADRKLQAQGWSTISLPGILGDSANKVMLAAYDSVGGIATQFCGTRSVRNFQEHSAYRMTGIGEFSQVGPGGELKHITLEEDSFTNQVSTYGELISVTRTMLINDDLNAFAQVPAMIGRRAATKLEETALHLLIDNTGNFYHSNNANLATSSALGTSGLAAAVLKLQKQTDANGKPILLFGKYLVVPSELDVTARQLMTTTGLVGGSSTVLNSNPWAGQFTVLSSPYLSNTSFHASASTSSWYLFTNPASTPSFVISYLNGQSRPTVESGDTDFNTLGIQMRGYFDFGVDQADPKGSVKATQ